MTCDPDTSPTDRAALSARREALSDFVVTLSAAVHALAMPRSFRDADRAARAITIGDRALQRVAAVEDSGGDRAVPALAQATRLVFRELADQVMAHANALPLPASFLECERAFRYALSADRMLLQMYQPPRRRRAGLAGHADDTYADALGANLEATLEAIRVPPVAAPVDAEVDDLADWKAGLDRMLTDMATACAPKPQTSSADDAPVAHPTPDAASAAPSLPPRPRLSKTALLNGIAACPP